MRWLRKPALQDIAARYLLAPLALLMLALQAQAAPLYPPLQALRHPHFVVISAEPVAWSDADSRVRVRVHEVLRGDLGSQAAEEIDLLVLPSDRKSLPAGQRYLIVYSDVQRAPLKVRKEVRRPDRRLLLHIDGASPAVFADTAAMRELLDRKHKDVELLADYRQTIIKGLQASEPAMVDLWSAELVLRPATFDRLSAAEARQVRKVVEDSDQLVTARARLLLAASDRSPVFGEDWFVRSAARIAKEMSRDLLTHDGNDQLILAALLILQRHPVTASAPALERWLSGPPVLAEQAALALRALGEDKERDAVTRALARDATPTETKRMFSAYLQRLTRQQDASKS
ncbi:MAG: hypothetical protein ACT4NL_00100 [Pseudomarimonas sp.]